MCFAPQRCALFRQLNLQKWSQHGVFCAFWLGNMLRATTACTFSTSQLSRHNGVHFFDISTSKSGPTMVCFVHFDFEMCFAPQRRALFRHLNFQKWSENGVFCTFWLRNVLRATTACNFSSLIWPAGSAPAALASLLFDPPEPQIIGKTQCFATFLTSLDDDNRWPEPPVSCYGQAAASEVLEMFFCGQMSTEIPSRWAESAIRIDLGGVTTTEANQSQYEEQFL